MNESDGRQLNRTEKVDTLNVVEWQEQHKEDNLESGNDDLTGS